VSLLEVQRTLSRILTDKAFRTAFQTDPAAAAAGYALDAAELASLAALPWRRMGTQADMLAHNRLGLALKAFPLTGRLLYEPVHQRLDEFCAEYPPTPVHGNAMLAEADRLLAFTQRLLAEDRLDPPWLGDMLRYELTTTRLAVTAAAPSAGAAPPDLAGADLASLVPVVGSSAVVLSFEYDVVDLVARLAGGGIPDDARPARPPQRLLFAKQPGTGAVRQFTVNAATVSLIGLCDQCTTVDVLLDRLAARLDAPRSAVEPAALRTLSNLRRIGALALQPVPSG
jgi:hypothetical protein